MVMRGVAIVGIMLHNWLHLCYFATENEFSFSIENSKYMWNHLHGYSVIHTIEDMISFIGWVGVGVFVFLSGYGLEKKYCSREVKPLEFLFKQWKKLFALMIVGVTFFVFWFWDSDSLRYLLTLTMFANLVGDTFLRIGVYWYFGLAFELYILWLLIRKMNVKGLAVVGVVLLAMKGCFMCTKWGIYLNHNIVGWGFLLVAGMIMARKMPRAEVKTWALVATTVVGTIGMFACNHNRMCWLLILPFLSVAVIWSVSKLMVKSAHFKQIGLWLGALSPFLFACHPIARALLLHPLCDFIYWPIRCLLFVATAMLMSMVYRWVYGKVMRK